MKQAAVLDCMYSVERSDQMLSHYSFERKTKLWKKFFFHLFDLVVVNAQILHNKSSKKITSPKSFYVKVAEVLASDEMEIQAQDQKVSPTCRHIGRDHSIYTIPATHDKLAGKYQLSFLVSAENYAPDVLQHTAENAM